jgi:CubicO group peptidase (beta-lactamase class C family)
MNSHCLSRARVARGTLLFLALLASDAVAAQTKASYSALAPDAFMKRWLVLAPIPVAQGGSPDEAAQKRVFTEDLLASLGGESGVEPAAGLSTNVAGRQIQWRLVEYATDIVDLGKQEFAVAYAWAEIEMPQKTRGLLGIGSDDAVKVWLNGKLVHEHWIGRGTHPDDDLVPVEFSAGRNRLLLKIQNFQAGWDFTCRLTSQTSQATRLVAAVRGGDLDSVTRLLEQGLDVNGRDELGLTAAQEARLRGEREQVEFLAGKGADTRATLPPCAQIADALVRRAFKSDGPGVAVLITQNGKIVFEKGYGLANLYERVPITPTTRFPIASLTKQFTAAAILKLQQDGKLSVQDQLSKFIPGFPRGNEVTLHHLLTHTSGIRGFTNKPGFDGSRPAGAAAEEHIRSFAGDTYDFDPGQKMAYSNSGYFLLGYVVEKASGQPYGAYLRKTFFEPLGMKDTGAREAGVKVEGKAIGYTPLQDGKLGPAHDDLGKADGAAGVYSTVEDLNRWAEALFGGRALEPASLAAALTPGKVAGDDPLLPKPIGYGYGWQIGDLRGLTEIGHAGKDLGFESNLRRVPARAFTVVMLANSNAPAPDATPGWLSRDIAELCLGDTLAPHEHPQVDTSVTVAALDAVVGRYDYRSAVLTVTRDGIRVFAQVSGEPSVEIFPKSQTQFFWKRRNEQLTFVKNAQGVVTKAVLHQDGGALDAPRLDENKIAQLDAQRYDAIVGRYDYGGGKTILSVTREGRRLFAQFTDQPKLELFPKSDNEFFWQVVGAQVAFVRDAQGKVTKAVHRQAGVVLDAPRIE